MNNNKNFKILSTGKLACRVFTADIQREMSHVFMTYPNVVDCCMLDSGYIPTYTIHGKLKERKTYNC